MLPPNNENLKLHGAPILARLLAKAANERSSLSYGKAAAILESEVLFSKIFSTRMGLPAGELMHRIHAEQPDAPLLNCLLVRQDTRYPGDRAGGFLAAHFGKEKLSKANIWRERPKLWAKYCDRAIAEVYAFEDWDRVLDRVFGPVATPATEVPQENDGKNFGGGEGENHKALRLWAMRNPLKIDRGIGDYWATTEVQLLSGDRVDVVFRGPVETICVEVKSIDSNEADLERGVYQCIKYHAVTKAMDARKSEHVRTMLVTQKMLPGHLAALAKLNGTGTIKAPYPLPKDG